ALGPILGPCVLGQILPPIRTAQGLDPTPEPWAFGQGTRLRYDGQFVGRGRRTAVDESRRAFPLLAARAGTRHRSGGNALAENPWRVARGAQVLRPQAG